MGQSFVEMITKWVGANSSEPTVRQTFAMQIHQIALGLCYLHSEDVVHGDLRGVSGELDISLKALAKSSVPQVNVLIEGNGTIRLSDFGFSVIVEATNSFSSSRKGGVLGWLTAEITDPEQYALTSARPTFASDAYLFGCVCIEVSRNSVFSRSLLDT